MNRNTVTIAAVLIAVAVALGLLINSAPKKIKTSSAVRQAAVQITSSGFVPATLVVKKGTKVTWTNADTAGHRVKANPYPEGTDLPGLDSKVNVPAGATYSYTFNADGTFNYHDQLSPTLNGTVKVTD